MSPTDEEIGKKAGNILGEARFGFVLGYRQAEQDTKEELRLIKQCYDHCQGKCDKKCKWELCIVKELFGEEKEC